MSDIGRAQKYDMASALRKLTVQHDSQPLNQVMTIYDIESHRGGIQNV